MKNRKSWITKNIPGLCLVSAIGIVSMFYASENSLQGKEIESASNIQQLAEHEKAEVNIESYLAYSKHYHINDRKCVCRYLFHKYVPVTQNVCNSTKYNDDSNADAEEKNIKSDTDMENIKEETGNDNENNTVAADNTNATGDSSNNNDNNAITTGTEHNNTTADTTMQVSDYTYTNEMTSIQITEETYYGAVCYVAHITTSDPNCLKTTFADGETAASWGSHATTSNVANRTGAVLVINGDFRDKDWGADTGIVRNGSIVQDKMMIDSIGITYDGNFVECTGLQLTDVIKMGVRDTWSFGPYLVKDGQAIEWNDGSRHPRTFIGQVKRDDAKLEYYFIIADGRQPGYSTGLTCTEMGKIMEEKGCYIAYNLDGGGSSAIVFKRELLNRPSEGSERYDADFIYIAE